MHDSAQIHPSVVDTTASIELRHAKSLPRWMRLEFWFPVGLIFCFCMVVSLELGYAASGGSEVYNPRVQSTAPRQVGFTALGATGFFLLFLARPSSPRSHPVWTIAIPVILLSTYVFLTVLWSEEPIQTFKRAITVLFVCMLGMGIGRAWSPRDLSWGIMTVSFLILVASLLVEMKYRSFLEVDDWRFSGIFHPAKQAFNCGFLLIASLSLYLARGGRWILVICAFAFAMLILTKARTGTAAAILSCGWLLWHYTSIRGWLLVGSAIAGICLAAVLFYQGVSGRELAIKKVTTMGRDEETADPTKLTGRLPIWEHAVDQFIQRPILGYGYGSFWTSKRFEDFERRNGWALFHSHSTYLESLLNLGLVGFGIGILALGMTFHRSITLKRSGDREAILVSAFLIFAFVAGFFEIAFVGLEYESLVMMSSIGVMAFAPPVLPQSSRRQRERIHGR